MVKKKSNKASLISFDDILAPISSEKFFADYYDKKPLYIPGTPDKFKNVMNWGVLTRLLNMNAIWSEESLLLVLDRKVISPEEYCHSEMDRNGNNCLRPDAEKVMDWLSKGASLGINDIDTLTPEIANVVTIFEKALTAKGQCNLYCSWHQRQAFHSHYDTHDVYAIHFEGEKTWRVWTNRMPHPVRHPRFISSGEDFDTKNRGEVLMEVIMKPGDLLYLPRGWYHDALSSSEGCNHIAFGMTHIIGLDLLTNISDMAVNQEIYRHNFPRLEEGRGALKAHAKKLISELADIVETDEFLDAFERFQENYYYKRGGFSLPIKATEIEFKIVDPTLKLQQHQGQWGLVGAKGGVAIPPGYEKPLGWVLSRKSFRRNEFTVAFADMGIDQLDSFLGEILRMKVIHKLT